MKAAIAISSVIALLLTMSACGTSPPLAPSVSRKMPKPATLDTVKGCDYLDDVVVTSSRYGIFAAAAVDDTRSGVLDKAAALGATHLVWDAPQLTHGSTTSRGKAYRCGLDHK